MCFPGKNGDSSGGKALLRNIYANRASGSNPGIINTLAKSQVDAVASRRRAMASTVRTGLTASSAAGGAAPAAQTLGG